MTITLKQLGVLMNTALAAVFVARKDMPVQVSLMHSVKIAQNWMARLHDITDGKTIFTREQIEVAFAAPTPEMLEGIERLRNDPDTNSDVLEGCERIYTDVVGLAAAWREAILDEVPA